MNSLHEGPKNHRFPTTQRWLPILFICLADSCREASLFQASAQCWECRIHRSGVSPQRCWHLLGACLWLLLGAQACTPAPECPACSELSCLTQPSASLLIYGAPRRSSMQPSAPRASVYLSHGGLGLRIFTLISQMTKPRPRQVKSFAQAQGTRG